MYRSIGFDDLGMEDTNNNDATEDNYIPTTNDVLQDVNYKRKKIHLFVQHRNSI